jgi:hypothetical protein
MADQEDITDYSAQELSLRFQNEEPLYILIRKDKQSISSLYRLVTDRFIYTGAQFNVLWGDYNDGVWED